MWKRLTGMGLALAMGGAAPFAPPARAASFGDDSEGATIAAGLAIAVVAVYGLVALRSDAERFAEATGGAPDPGAWERAAAAAEASPVVLEALESHDRLKLGEARQDGLALGVRVSF